jgi:hypothetical protein
MVGYAMERHLDQRAARGEDYVISFEYQLVDDERHPDARRGPKYQTGSLYGLVAPSHAATRPVGEFNRSRIVLRGNHVEHWLNGEKVVDTTLDSPAVGEGLAARWRGTGVLPLLTGLPRRDCPIALQNHNDPAWFRSLRIRRLN